MPNYVIYIKHALSLILFGRR